MQEAHLKDVNESLELLSNYRDRLQKEVITIATKLQMPKEKINATLIKDNRFSFQKIYRKSQISLFFFEIIAIEVEPHS